eukprot:159100-Pelagomonas_calceolata.AAC.1
MKSGFQPYFWLAGDHSSSRPFLLLMPPEVTLMLTGIAQSQTDKPNAEKLTQPTHCLSWPCYTRRLQQKSRLIHEPCTLPTALPNKQATRCSNKHSLSCVKRK